MRFLIVDDDKVDRLNIIRAVRNESLYQEIEEAEDSKTALEMIEQSKFDIILLDYSLPIMSGLDLLRQLPTNCVQQSSIVMVSGDEDLELAKRCLKAGAEDFVLKSEVNHRRMALTLALVKQRHAMKQEILLTQEQLRKLAEQDSLTGVANRFFFEENLRLSIARAKRTGSVLSLLLLDLDNFKSVNDTLGHAVGDELLRQVCSRLESALRSGDLLARLGGDEFVVLSTNLNDPTEARRIVQRMQTSLTQPFEIEGKRIPVSSSVGVAFYPNSSEDASGLVRCADIAMYRAKRDGRNQYYFHSEKLQSEIIMRTLIEWDLSRAIKKEEFELYYQPQYCARDHRIVGVEALIRWNHPELGFLGPDKFLHIAEECGELNTIGEWVIHTACHQMKDWQRKYNFSENDIRIAVNLSDTQLCDDHTVESIRRAIDDSGLSTKQLEIELTEASMVKDPKSTARILEKLHQMGLRIALDDFGTGFSSFAHLQNFPIDCIKIDKDCLQEIEMGGKKSLFVKSLIKMGKEMQIFVVVEGTETKEQALLCTQWQADILQGYYFSKPLPAQQVGRLLNKDRAYNEPNINH